MIKYRRLKLFGFLFGFFCMYLLYRERLQYLAVPATEREDCRSRTEKNESLDSLSRTSYTESGKSYLMTTRAKESKLLLYNRVPKCGSSAMIWTFDQLSKRLGYHLISIDWRIHPAIHFEISLQVTLFTDDSQLHYTAHILKEIFICLRPLKEPSADHDVAGIAAKIFAILAELVKNISRLPVNVIYVRHLHFLDFVRFGEKFPTYINVIRDPVERFISFFYFKRHGFAKNKGMNLTSKANSTETLEECISQSGRCWPSYRTTLAYFCGHEEQCRNLSEYALTKAKENVVKHFSMVGILEDMRNTLKVLEALFPGYFKDVEQIYFSSPEIERSKTFKRGEHTEEIKALIRQKLKYEVEFYEFVRERFYKQVEELEKQNRII